MSVLIRERKDVVDQRPMPLNTEAKLHNFLWKLQALLEIDDDGKHFIFPFSRRKVDLGPLLWPRNSGCQMPPGYIRCGCVGCEKKTFDDHIFEDDHAHPEDGDLHLERVYPNPLFEMDSASDSLSVSEFDWK